MSMSSDLDIDLSDGTTDKTGSPGGDETGFLTGGGVSGDGGSLSDMLVVTTSVGVVDGVHSNTTSLRPVVPLTLSPEVGSSSLQQRLIDPSTSSNNPDSAPRRTANRLLRPTRQPNPRLLILNRVSNDRSIVPRSPSEGTTIPGLLLDVADDGSFGALTDREDVTDVEGGFLSAVDEGTGGETFGGDEGFGAELVPVGVAEDDGGQGGTTTSVMDNILHDPPDVSILLGVIQVPELGRVLVQVGVGLEDSTGFTLVSDDSLLRREGE